MDRGPTVVAAHQGWAADLSFGQTGQTDCRPSAAPARCAGAQTASDWTTNQTEKQVVNKLGYLLYNCLVLDTMVKQRRVRAHSCCAAVAPLCCRRGPLKVSMYASFAFTQFYMVILVCQVRWGKGKDKSLCSLKNNTVLYISFTNGCDCDS